MDIKKIRELVGILDESDVNEIEIRGLFKRVRISKSTPGISSTVISASPMAPVLPAMQAEQALPSGSIPITAGTEPETPSEDSSLLQITSPMVGTFYRSPSPDSPTFVEEGEAVSVGAVICIVEAMKVMNEIESEIAGKIVKIHVSNAEPVEYGQVLFSIKP